MSNLGDLGSAALLLATLLASSAFSHCILPHLPEHHRSRETLDMVRLVSSLIVTFAALVLGLLIASVNTAFFDVGRDMNALAGSVRQTDTCLRDYGPEADPIRSLLRRYVAGAIASTWPNEPAPQGDHPVLTGSGLAFESLELGNILQRVRMGIVHLDAPDSVHKQIADLCSGDLSKLLDQRWKLIGEARKSISLPFYRVLWLMLVATFACFGLSAPRNSLSWATVGIAALTISASVFVVLELDGPLGRADQGFEQLHARRPGQFRSMMARLRRRRRLSIRHEAA